MERDKGNAYQMDSQPPDPVPGVPHTAHPMPEPAPGPAASPSSPGSLIVLAWRRSADAPSLEEVLRAQREEEDLFRQTLELARQEEQPLAELYLNMERLAYPTADPALLRKAAERDAYRALHWREELDEDGNPRWISLSLPERRDPDSQLAPASVLPDERTTAAPLEDGAAPPPVAERRGLLGRLLNRAKGSPREETDAAQSPYARLRAARAKPPKAPSPLKRFLFRLLRVVLFLIIIYELYRIFLRWGMAPGVP